MEQLWQQYQATRNVKLRNELMECYLPLVKRVVGRMGIRAVGFCDEEDLLSYGLFGLLQAIEKYDVSRGVKFESYASSRIRGAVLDELRKHQLLPRSVTDKLAKLQQVQHELQQQAGREVSDGELADALGNSLEEVQQLWCYAGYQAMVSLDEWDPQGGETFFFGQLVADDNSPDPELEFDKREIRRILVEAIGFLQEKERILLNLYYFEGLTMKEIGSVLEISESRVCQLHGRSLWKLRGKVRELGGMEQG